ncbi:hypothetical protein PSU4_28840 [Pseudonocardia sulfidoxydans NBRC 16205]|uniref:Uncharacterized protein n=1 Tax=Pseudonocardia sulfidoxydans NBRC 16205 TaxID=1223511 RepID=A0A511DGL3_9PSEU|nr:hypothetical protein PSU4_28840 [Pseudonocardia sulfidoxydans NBRC 16205]
MTAPRSSAAGRAVIWALREPSVWLMLGAVRTSATVAMSDRRSGPAMGRACRAARSAGAVPERTTTSCWTPSTVTVPIVVPRYEAATS